MPEYQKLIYWPNENGEWFDHSQVMTTTAGYNGWAITDTSSTGTPTYTTINGGGVTLTLDATSEAELVVLYQKDILPFDVDEIQVFSFYARVTGSDSATLYLMGLAGAHNATADSIAQNAWFRIQGSGDVDLILCETDDGTTDLDDKSAAQNLTTVLRKFTIDFTRGKSDIRFYVDDNPVATSTTFTLAAYTGSLQPYFSVQKTSGTGAQTLTIIGIEPVLLSRSLA